MSRLFECCKNDDTRIDQAAAYMLGLLIYFNERNKKRDVLQSVQRLGYTQQEVFEALMLLTSTNLVETRAGGCLGKRTRIELTEMARVLPMPRIFEELERTRSSKSPVSLDDFKDVAVKIATGALATALV